MNEAAAPPHLPDDRDAERRLSEARDSSRALLAEVARSVIGQTYIAENLVAALFARGHCLLIGVPGLAKTLLVKTLAQALQVDFKRIQFTPDLMPGDILGTELLETDPQSGERRLRFAPGPIFTNVLLADEINRTPPKTQSALLEAMQEYSVTVGGRTLPIEPPFFVVATQNPIEQEGTYPLPEAQLDRFMFSLRLDYPRRSEEERVAMETTSGEAACIRPAITREALLSMQELVRSVPVSPHLVSYAVSIARSSRPKDPEATTLARRYVEWGAGPRASQYLVLGAKSRAALLGRSTPTTADVRAVAQQVLNHRVLVNYAAMAEGVASSDIVEDLLKQVKEPDYAR